MSAQIVRFPHKNGNPLDPNVRVVQGVFAELGEPMSDDQARTFTREFMDELQRLQRLRKE